MYPAGREPKRVRSATRGARNRCFADREKSAPGANRRTAPTLRAQGVARRTSMPAKPTVTSIKALPGREIATGVTIKPLAGDHVMLNYVQFVPEGVVPLPSHHHE